MCFVVAFFFFTHARFVKLASVLLSFHLNK
jgi:hypothetical protein